MKNTHYCTRCASHIVPKVDWKKREVCPNCLNKDLINTSKLNEGECE